jgi:aerobic-type carbon monoxide dehydrogenase small subunit (CoxS/CutS family)
MKHQRGEGKIGCIVSLLVFGALAAAGYKAVPVYYSDSELVDACDFIASGAAKKPIETIEREIRDKAKELAIPEALMDKNAIRVTKAGTGEASTCTIVLRYKRTIDFYGTYQWTKETNKRISKPIFENIG